MTHEVHIRSYFSLPTDLAGTMRTWSEFQSGEGYFVNLRSADGSESISVRLLEDDNRYVSITSSSDGELFFRVIGAVTYALGAHSDNLLIDRVR
jgi:hypothetical protein